MVVLAPVSLVTGQYPWLPPHYGAARIPGNRVSHHGPHIVTWFWLVLPLVASCHHFLKIVPSFRYLANCFNTHDLLNRLFVCGLLEFEAMPSILNPFLWFLKRGLNDTLSYIN